MKKAIDIINLMKNEGIISNYAIGGGIGALFYIEPFATFDLDVFIILPQKTGLLISLTPIYEWCTKRGYIPDKEQIIIEGIPVQFIPVYNDLIAESVENSTEKDYNDSKAIVLRPEYLIAIMIQTMRLKDRERIIRMLDEAEVDREVLNDILIRHNLKNKYNEIIKK